MLLVDTYNTLKSGVPDAIRAFNEVLKPQGIRQVRHPAWTPATSPTCPSKARKMLDEAGWTECQISASNSLDEYIIRDLLLQGAKVDMLRRGRAAHHRP